jgi:hypothetical protein
MTDFKQGRCEEEGRVFYALQGQGESGRHEMHMGVLFPPDGKDIERIIGTDRDEVYEVFSGVAEVRGADSLGGHVLPDDVVRLKAGMRYRIEVLVPVLFRLRFLQPGERFKDARDIEGMSVAVEEVGSA